MLASLDAQQTIDKLCAHACGVKLMWHPGAGSEQARWQSVCRYPPPACTAISAVISKLIVWFSLIQRQKWFLCRSFQQLFAKALAAMREVGTTEIHQTVKIKMQAMIGMQC